MKLSVIVQRFRDGDLKSASSPGQSLRIVRGRAPQTIEPPSVEKRIFYENLK